MVEEKPEKASAGITDAEPAPGVSRKQLEQTGLRVYRGVLYASATTSVVRAAIEEARKEQQEASER